MLLSLFDCLKLVGLQRLHERFISQGIRHAIHLLALTSENLPLLEIHSAEDKRRLFKLLHLVRTLQKEGLPIDDGADDQDVPRKRPAQHSNQKAGNTRPDISKRLFAYSAPPPLKNVTHQPDSHQQPRHRTAFKRHTDKASHPMPVYEAKRKPGYNYGLPLQTASTKKQTHGPRIIVCVRKRPLTLTEKKKGEADVVITPSAECVIVEEGKEAVDLTQYILQHPFYFDQVFGEYHTNEEVYKKTAYPLVQHMLNGGKATCFAFGQTGAGKTHTMMGSAPGEAGLYVLAVHDIFAHLSRTHSPLLVLFVREDGHNVVHIAGLFDVRVGSIDSLLKVISQGLTARKKRVSGVNPLSSRSHALLQIQLRSPNQQIIGRMWFIDLAGSERASDTTATDWQTRMEGAEINQSLLALKECIRSLDQEQRHTPFRQSKLTQVLKDSFLGNSMTCMIANISPGHVATEHTLNTLRYADRVKELRGRGGECTNTVPSKCNAVGKSLPKKPKMGPPRPSFCAVSSTSRKHTGCDVQCPPPKSNRSEEGRAGRTKSMIGPAEARNSLEKGDGGHSCGNENRRFNMSTDASSEAQKELTEGDKDAAMVNEEMQQHLRHYHRQLQMFVPFSVSLPSSSCQSISSSTTSSGCLKFSDRPGLKDAPAVYDSGIGASDSFREDGTKKVQIRSLSNLEQADTAMDVAVVSFNSQENRDDSLEMDPSLDGLWTDCLMSVNNTCGSPPLHLRNQEVQFTQPISSVCGFKSGAQAPQEQKSLARLLQNTQEHKVKEVHKYPEDKAKMFKDDASSISLQAIVPTVQENQISSHQESLKQVMNKDREAKFRSSTFDTKLVNRYIINEDRTYAKQYKEKPTHANDERREFCPQVYVQSCSTDPQWDNKCTRESLRHARSKDREFFIRPATSDIKLAKRYIITEDRTYAEDKDADLCLPKDLHSPTSAGKLAKNYEKEHLTHAKNKDDENNFRSPISDTKVPTKCTTENLTHTKDSGEIYLPVDTFETKLDNKYRMIGCLTHSYNKDQELCLVSPTSKLADKYKKNLRGAKDEDTDLCLPKDLWSHTCDTNVVDLTQGPSCASKTSISATLNKNETTEPNLTVTPVPKTEDPSKLLETIQTDGHMESNSEDRLYDPEFSITTDNAKWRVIQAHLEKLRKMEPLLQEEQTLLCKQPQMAFLDYVDKLEEIQDRNAQYLRSMRTKLRLYRMTSSFSESDHKQGEQ
ncbi:uncharacterized protein LOC130913699 isoform X2 [Corythoichthys intestinalis]|uniref:uncharacterized protein LOC130913699 isoform X2 n=1 Tax=Corythoichthys intestinalis TaxID=161448 RepID=UPI0025A573D0|nr:uncharacterized protein LOC130913699 isoform X2 [Corythoichthys intestinalis]